MPLLLLLVAFVVVPLVEVALIQQVADVLSWWPTIGLLVADSLLGAVLVRREGARAWQEFREALAAGRVPGDELIGGVLLLFGGALLLTPGFLTDVLGLSLVVPLTRKPIAKLIRLRGVPVPLQVVTGGWNASRPPTDGRPGRGSGGRDGDGGAPGVEVLSVERDEPPQVGDGRADR